MIIKNLLDDLNKFYSQINLDNIQYNLVKITNHDIVDTEFIPDKIKNYIEKEIKYKYVINYNYKNNKNNIINLEYFFKEEINTDIFKTIIKRVIFMMIISNKYQDINIQIYDTPFKKTFSCNNHDKCGKLNYDNVNSGLSYYNNIVIFRKEEYLKLLIHELIHGLDIDYKYETNSDKIELYKLLKINKNNLLINESYVETWAIIINIFLVLKEKNDSKNNVKNEFILFKKYIKSEIIHGLKESAKLCKYYNITKFNDLHIVYYSDNVNTFSYHMVKTINLFNIKNFIKNFRSNNYIIPHKYKFDNYIKFVIKYYKTISKYIDVLLKKKLSLTSLNMSIIK